MALALTNQMKPKTCSSTESQTKMVGALRVKIWGTVANLALPSNMLIDEDRDWEGLCLSCTTQGLKTELAQYGPYGMPTLP